MANTIEIVIQSKDQATKGISGVGNALSSLGKAAAGVGAAVGKIALAGVAAGVAALGAGLAIAVKEAIDAQQNLAQLNQVIKSTGGVAGVTAEMALKLADSFSTVTKFSDDEILSMENLLLTFTSISKEVFPDVTEAALDMSEALGQDLKSSAIQLGKALQDPINGITALRRVGVNFTQEQEDMIKKMVEAGDVMGAQKYILAELRREFGGSAKAAGKTFGGQLVILKNRLLNMAEAIGTSVIPVLQNLLNTALQKIMPFLDKLQANFTDAFDYLGRQLSTFGLSGIFVTFEDGSSILSNFLEKLGLGSGIAKTVAQAFSGLWFGLQKIWSSIQTNLLPALGRLFGALFGGGRSFTTVKDAIDGVSTWIANKLIPAVAMAANWLATNLPPAIQAVANFFSTVLVPAIQKVWTWIQVNLIPVLRQVWDWLATNIPPAIQALSNFWTNTLLPAIQSVWSWIQTNLIPVFQDLAAWLSENIPVALQAIQTAWSTVFPYLVSGFNYFIQAIRNAMAIFKAAWAGDWTEVGRLLRVGFDFMLQLATTAFQSLLSKGKEINWAQIGIDIIQGIVSGMLSMQQLAIDVISDILRAMYDMLKAFFETGSPSKLMKRFFSKDVMGGAVIGIQQGGRAASQAMGGAMATIGRSVSSGLPAFPGPRVPALATSAAAPAYARAGGGNMTFIYSPGMSLGDRREMETQAAPFIRSALRRRG